MPAAAVTPAPIAYIKAAAVKKLVVGSQARIRWFTVQCFCWFPPNQLYVICSALYRVL